MTNGMACEFWNWFRMTTLLIRILLHAKCLIGHFQIGVENDEESVHRRHQISMTRVLKNLLTNVTSDISIKGNCLEEL